MAKKQRIAIARALYRNRQIIIFDEPTSSLDTESENQIIETIKKLKVNHTVIISSHKKSIINICDKIYEVHDKKLKIDRLIMIRLKISEDKIIRLKKFLDSENFQNSYSKSEMWKEFTRSSKIAFEKNFVIIQGDSGLYFRNLNFFKKFISKFKNLIVNYNKLPIFLSYKQAFELVMQNQQARGKKQLNFNQKPFHKIFKNFDEILEDKPFKSYNFDYYETKHYYLFNVLRTYIDFNKLNNVLEIGGGSGHFLTLITNYHSNIKSYINVDLPETIIFSICFTMNFSNEDICLPNEANTENILK